MRDITKLRIVQHRQDSKRNTHKIIYKGKDIRLPYNPREGFCMNCGDSVLANDINRTHLHHLKYDDERPLAHTIELCISCHNEVT